STLLLPHYPFSCTTTSPPDIYTLSLHDALPILTRDVSLFGVSGLCPKIWRRHPSPEKWCQTPFFALFRASRGNGCQAPISGESVPGTQFPRGVPSSCDRSRRRPCRRLARSVPPSSGPRDDGGPRRSFGASVRR